MTYLEEIILSLQELNGMASLREICENIRLRDTLPSIHTNPNWTYNVRTTIQRHCSQTLSYKGAEDVFYSVYGLGEGYWGLKDYISERKKEDNAIIERLIQSVEQQDIDVTEKEMIIKARIGQGVFRERLIDKYKCCLITGITDKRLLLASHIKPWRSSNNTERLSAENGLLLYPLYDKLFDIGLITFDRNMKIVISNNVSKSDRIKIGFDSNKSYIINPSIELKQNMEYHRDVIFKQ